jgi:excisionase family DNA binding protein
MRTNANRELPLRASDREDSSEGRASVPHHQESVARQPHDVIAADDVAALLKVNRKTVYEAAGRGQLPSRRLGRRVLFSRNAVLAWLQCKASSESEQ